jgi:hypothetical protein
VLFSRSCTAHRDDSGQHGVGARARVHWLGGKPDEIDADTPGRYKLILVLRKLRLVPVIRGMGDSETLEDLGGNTY